MKVKNDQGTYLDVVVNKVAALLFWVGPLLHFEMFSAAVLLPKPVWLFAVEPIALIPVIPATDMPAILVPTFS